MKRLNANESSQNESDPQTNHLNTISMRLTMRCNDSGQSTYAPSWLTLVQPLAFINEPVAIPADELPSYRMASKKLPWPCALRTVFPVISQVIVHKPY